MREFEFELDNGIGDSFTVVGRVYPSQKRTIHVKLYRFYDDFNPRGEVLGEVDAFVWIPPTVFVTSAIYLQGMKKRRLAVGAVSDYNAEINTATEVFMLPLPNIYERFEVCLGAVGSRLGNDAITLASLVDYFWNSEFYRHDSGYWPGERVLRKIVGHSNSILDQYVDWQKSSPNDISDGIFKTTQFNTDPQYPIKTSLKTLAYCVTP